MFSDDASNPNGLVFRAYSASLTGFLIGADTFAAEHLASQITISYYACGF